ncbi:hypothetical protein AGR7A_Lc120039 [Agrobacterium deltaense NCPPB 1641]|uniref:Uncharacterized protein n=1 Tax=Agrobacterium deltaense NCPPB 1641 TaxID=1183425 RepID=A0A1S7TUR2_9HYPH|nr:hypothetical protein AGR7A_Lc120039 [Agrobacterium deltaense NCPPB 1641]
MKPLIDSMWLRSNCMEGKSRDVICRRINRLKQSDKMLKRFTYTRGWG